MFLYVIEIRERFIGKRESEFVTPRSGGYGDATATYIRRSELSSRIYAKHQYKQESEYKSAWHIYTFQHKDYKVITEHDILVHVHYHSQVQK